MVRNHYENYQIRTITNQLHVPVNGRHAVLVYYILKYYTRNVNFNVKL